MSSIMVKLKVDKIASKKGIKNASQLSAAASQIGLTLHLQTAYDLWNNTAERIALSTIDILCEVLDCSPGALFDRVK